MCLFHIISNKTWPHQLGPRYEGQLMSDGGAYSPFRSILLVLTHDFIITYVSTDRRVVTDMNGKTRTLRCALFLCRLRRRECCMLGAPSSQPTVHLHKLPPARLVIHRQTSAHERRKWTRSVQSRSGILAYLYRNQLPAYFENFIPEYGESQHDIRHNNIRLHANRSEYEKMSTKYQMQKEIAQPQGYQGQPDIWRSL